MAFIVEDGTGVVDANSLASVEFADSYFAERGIVAWTGDAAVKQIALIMATDYFETRFAAYLKSCPVAADQALSFPREDYDLVPLKIRKGISEYALRALTAPLLTDPTVDASGRTVQRSKKAVGPLLKEIEYAESSAIRIFKPYPAADILFRDFLVVANRVIR